MFCEINGVVADLFLSTSRTLTRCSDIDVARRIFADEIDILVDVMGYTVDMRMGIVAAG